MCTNVMSISIPSSESLCLSIVLRCFSLSYVLIFVSAKVPTGSRWHTQFRVFQGFLSEGIVCEGVSWVDGAPPAAVRGPGEEQNCHPCTPQPGVKGEGESRYQGLLERVTESSSLQKNWVQVREHEQPKATSQEGTRKKYPDLTLSFTWPSISGPCLSNATKSQRTRYLLYQCNQSGQLSGAEKAATGSGGANGRGLALHCKLPGIPFKICW